MDETENPPETTPEADAVPAAIPPAAIPTTMPEGLPEKFWDRSANSVRLDSMIKSYGELERKLGAQIPADVPDGPDGYDVAMEGSQLEADAEVNARLHQAGFSHDQARLVYQLANEKLLPMLTGMAEDYRAEAQVEQLQNHFGGPEKWRQTSRQLQAWGRANLADDIYQTLSSSRDGVLTLHRMMQSGEPGIGPGTGSGGGDDESSLKEIMNDPRYWRDRDPATVEKVRQGFRSLYPQ